MKTNILDRSVLISILNFLVTYEQALDFSWID